ncbi:MAG: hypothetical protein ACTSYL_08585 [Candidatus Thorarchaeota archaeon]
MTKDPIHREKLKAFKERMKEKGYPTEELMTRHKYFSKIVREVKKAIQAGNDTVPKIVEALDNKYPSYEVFRAVTALHHWAQLKIVDKTGEYPVYTF